MYHTRKRIKGRQYWYLQKSWREGKRVRTKSYYIGPVGAAVGVLKVGVKLATNKALRDRIFGELEPKERPQEKPFEVKFEDGGKLRFSEWTPEVFQGEALSGKSAPSSEGANTEDSEP